MKIEFFNTNLSRIENKIGEIEITADITLRISNDKNKISFKLRNTKFEEMGRVLKINNIETINKISFAGEVYENLVYTQHELYIHQPNSEEFTSGMSEDLNITFKKGVANEQIQQ